MIENYGLHLGIKDEQFKDLGVKILKNEPEVLSSSDIIVQLGMLSDDKILNIRENQTVVGVLNPYKNKDLAKIICNVVKAINPEMPIMCLAGSPMVSVIQNMGLKPISEAFADRTYESDGSLRKRTLSKALIVDPKVLFIKLFL